MVFVDWSWVRNRLNNLLGSHKESPLKVAVLAVTASEVDRKCLLRTAEQSGWELTLADTCEMALRKLDQHVIPVILCDRDLPGIDWRESANILLQSAHSACFILISSVNDEYLLQEVIRRGGYDVLSKPLHDGNLVNTVNFAWHYWNFALPRK